MKLATRYQRSYLLLTIVIFLTGSSAFYLLLHRVLLFQMDEDLEIEQREIETYVSRFQALPQNVLPVEDQLVTYTKTNAPLPRPVRSTQQMWDAAEQETGAFRQLMFTVRLNGQWYQAAVSKSLEATNGLTRQIALIALSIIALLLVVLFLINRYVLRKLWKPFYATIAQLKSFGIDKRKGLTLPAVETDEFTLLNATLAAASDKAVKDYALLKTFTENASHELQTPLAVVRSKLDLLIQDEVLSANQSRIIEDAYTALAKMKHLNQSLLELAKIESGQYTETIPIDMQALLLGKIRDFEELLQSKEIMLTKQLSASTVRINPTTAEMLLDNLLSNAIYHNTSGGRIEVALGAGHISVCNTSGQSGLDPATLFTRFNKAGQTARTGLGLSIIKQICEATGCDVQYQFMHDELHCFQIFWLDAQSY